MYANICFKICMYIHTSIIFLPRVIQQKSSCSKLLNFICVYICIVKCFYVFVLIFTYIRYQNNININFVLINTFFIYSIIMILYKSKKQNIDFCIYALLLPTHNFTLSASRFKLHLNLNIIMSLFLLFLEISFHF